MGRVAGRRHFIRTLMGRFPDIAARIDRYSRGLLHCEVGFLAAATREALERGDEAEVRAHFEYAERLMSVAGPALENALQVSYLESIDFDKEYPNRVRPRLLLPPLLSDSLRNLEEHLERIYRHSRDERRS